MTHAGSHRNTGRIAALVALGGTLGLGVGGLGLSMHGLPDAAAAAMSAGPAVVVTPDTSTSSPLAPLSTGGSATPFTLKVPAMAACAGDSTTGGYRVESFLVPATVDPATLTFGSQGPTASGTEFRKPLYDTSGSPYVKKVTQNATPPAVTGQLNQAPAFDFAIYAPGDIPAGTYRIGLACTRGPVSATQLDRYWSARLTVVANPADSPAQITWTAAADAIDPTTTTTTTLATGSSTSTTSSSATTSTTSATSTTSTAGSGSSSGSGSGSGDGTAAAGTTAAKQLPKTGATFFPLLAWAFLLLCFGRAAVLLGRPTRSSDRP